MDYQVPVMKWSWPSTGKTLIADHRNEPQSQQRQPSIRPTPDEWQTYRTQNPVFGGRSRPVAAGNKTEAAVSQNAMLVQCVDRVLSPPPKGRQRAVALGRDDLNATQLACVF